MTKIDRYFGEAKHAYDERQFFELSESIKRSLLTGEESLEDKIKQSLNSIRKTREKWRLLIK